MITTTTDRHFRCVCPMRMFAVFPCGRPIWATVLAALVLLPGCAGEDPASTPPATPAIAETVPTGPSGNGNGYGYGGYGSYYGAGEIRFLDEATTNATPEASLTELVFVDVDGKERSVSDLAGEKHLILVITRGNTTPICPYCSTQVARLIARYDEIAERGAEVVAVYPIETGEDRAQLDAFLENSRNRLDDPKLPMPFPVVLDVELQAVDRLGIRKDLSKPATYIVDREGRVRFAYVGANIADRPGVDAIIGQLDQILADDLPSESPEETAETL